MQLDDLRPDRSGIVPANEACHILRVVPESDPHGTFFRVELLRQDGASEAVRTLCVVEGDMVEVQVLAPTAPSAAAAAQCVVGDPTGRTVARLVGPAGAPVRSPGREHERRHSPDRLARAPRRLDRAEAP